MCVEGIVGIATQDIILWLYVAVCVCRRHSWYSARWWCVGECKKSQESVANSVDAQHQHNEAVIISRSVSASICAYCCCRCWLNYHWHRCMSLDSQQTLENEQKFNNINYCCKKPYVKVFNDILLYLWTPCSSPTWAREHCRISPPRFLAECRMRRLNQTSFVLLYFVLFAFSGLCLVFVIFVFCPVYSRLIVLMCH